MSFIKGFIIGMTFGVAVGSNISERQRREIADQVRSAAKEGFRPMGEALRRNTSEVVDAAAENAASKIDAAGEAVAEKVGTNGQTTTT